MKHALLFILLIADVAGTAAAPRTIQLDDVPAPLAHDRDEAAQDRIAALVHFAAGRTLQQRGEFARACRHFARADRLDPASLAARSALVACAVESKRYALAARYAAKGIDPDEAGEESLELLTDYWVKDGNLAAAIRSSEQLLALLAARRDRAAESADDEAVGRIQVAELNVRFALRELYGLAGRQAQAADQAARIRDVLDHPQQVRLKDASAATLLDVEPRAAWRALGDTFLAADRFTEAEAAFRKSNALSPDAAVLDFDHARIDARQGRAEVALAKLQPYFNRHMASEGAVPYQLLADMLKKLGKQAELLDRLEKLHSSDPANVPLGLFLAGECLMAGKLDLAESTYLDLSARDQNAGAAALTGPLFTAPALAEIYRRQHMPDKLLSLLGKVFAASGTLDAFGPETKRLDSDEALYRDLVAAGRKKAKGLLAPADYAEYLALGTLAQERKQHAAAGEFFELALTADPRKAAEVLLAWGIGLLMDERTDEAAKVFQRGIDAKVMPGGSPVFHFYLSSALAAGAESDSARLDGALLSASTAARLGPDSARYAARVAWLLFRARRYNEARQAYEKLLDKFAGAGNTRAEAESLETSLALREARLELSAVCVNLSLMDEAGERLEEVLDEYPDDVEANNDLGFLWADENKHLPRALTMISLAVAAEPDNRAFRDSLGWVYYRLGRYAEAAVELQKAVDEKLPDATVLDHLGDACLKLGKAGKARDAWRRAKAAHEKDKEPQKARTIDEKLKRGGGKPEIPTAHSAGAPKSEKISK